MDGRADELAIKSKLASEEHAHKSSAYIPARLMNPTYSASTAIHPAHRADPPTASPRSRQAGRPCALRNLGYEDEVIWHNEGADQRGLEHTVTPNGSAIRWQGQL